VPFKRQLNGDARTTRQPDRFWPARLCEDVPGVGIIRAAGIPVAEARGFAPVFGKVKGEDGRRRMKRFYTFEGELLGFVAGRRGQLNRCRLQTADGELLVKFPREWSERLQRSLAVGDRVQVRGKARCDEDTGEQYLKAEVFLHLASAIPRAALLEDRAGGEVHPFAPAQTRPRAEAPPGLTRVLVCKSSDCCRRGARQVIARLEDAVERYGLQERVRIETTGCMKRCKQGPALVVLPQKARHCRVAPDEAPELLLREVLPKLE
jgi:(2Fe-2S) ferredoxin